MKIFCIVGLLDLILEFGSFFFFFLVLYGISRRFDVVSV